MAVTLVERLARAGLKANVLCKKRYLPHQLWLSSQRAFAIQCACI